MVVPFLPGQTKFSGFFLKFLFRKNTQLGIRKMRDIV